MAQVEVIMYVALGFATAALIALLLGRLLWNVAVGVGRRQQRRTSTTPAVAELQAERNELRAQNAMLARKVELRLDDLKRQVAEQMAEVSRSRNRIGQLSAEIATRSASLAERDGEVARLKDLIGLFETELATRTASLHELQIDQDKQGQAGLMLRQQLADREREIEELRGEIDRLGVAKSQAAVQGSTVQQRLKGRIADLTALAGQIEAQRRELGIQQSQSLALRERLAEQRQPEPGATSRDMAGGGELRHDPPLERRIEDAERQASELQTELDRLDEMWAAKLADVARAVASEPAAGNEAVAREPVTLPPDARAAKVVAETEPPVQPVDNTVAPAGEDKKSQSGLANVISLAQRIRALQRNGS